MKNKLQFICLGLILIIAVAVRLYQLDTLPGEMWGDVVEHYKMSRSAMVGKLPLTSWFGGDGPLISYIGLPIIYTWGLSFYSLKLVTVFIGLAMVYLTYLCSQLLFNKVVTSLLATFFMASWFWPLSFSRQTKPYILASLCIMLVYYFWLKKARWLTGLFIALGMLSQASFWGAWIFSFTHWKTFILALGLTILLLMPQFRMIFNLDGYIGTKLSSSTTNFNTTCNHLLTILKKNIYAFTVQGDPSFRHTIPNKPFLDPISGLFFLAGLFITLWGIIFTRGHGYSKNILLPFLFIQIPSVLDIQNWQAGPHMGRMTVALPFVVFITAHGMSTLIQLCSRFRRTTLILFSALLLMMIYLNFYDYFKTYPLTLPLSNTPSAKIISTYISENYIPEDSIVLAGCCWSDYGQPEPHSLLINLPHEYKLLYLDPDTWKLRLENIMSRINGRSSKIVVILSPDPKSDTYIYFSETKNILKEDMISENKINIARILEISTVQNPPLTQDLRSQIELRL